MSLHTAEQIETAVFKIVFDHMGLCDDEQVTREMTFINDLNADSLDWVELTMQVEDEFDIYIPDEDVERIKTVGDVIDYVTKKTTQPSR